jgi:anti-sigma factor RsiW
MTTHAETARQARELLAFWVNGTLRDAEAAFVEQALAADPGLAREAETLERVRSSMKAAETPAGPGEFVLARLHRSIASGNTPARRSYIPLVLAAGLAAAATFLLATILPLGGQSASYGLAAVEDSASRVTIALRAGVPAERITALLTDNALTISGGPSALGFYQLTLAEGAQFDAVLAALSAPGSPVEVIEYQE